MDPSPLATPTRQSTQELPSTPQTRDFARHSIFSPGGSSITPTSSRQTEVPLLPTSHPFLPAPNDHETHTQRTKWRLFLGSVNGFMLGKEKASVYWYASLLSVLAALVVTFSSIFGWPPLPIWEFLRHAAGR